MHQINLSVQGIDSPSCIAIIKKAIGSLDSVISIHVDWESGRVQVERDSIDSEDLIHALVKAGYFASLDLDEPNS